MSNHDELNAEIEKLEAMPLTYATVEKLAMLYTVRDHMEPENMPRTTAENKIEKMGESEFFMAIAGKDEQRTWEIIDELVSSVRAVYPKLYDAFIAKIQ